MDMVHHLVPSTEIWNQYLHKETKETVGPFHSAYIRHSYSKKKDKNFTGGTLLVEIYYNTMGL